MAPTTSSGGGPTAAAARALQLIPGGRPEHRDRAVRRARDARRQLTPRHERFAHLKRVYD